MPPPCVNLSGSSEEVSMGDGIFFRPALALVIATLALGSVTDYAVAGTKVIKGKFSASTVGLDCINTQGTFTAGIGPGGYGCKTDKGEVSCSSNGTCIGTCGNCSARIINRVGIDGVLRGYVVVRKARNAQKFFE
jgi:hypothetical protein